MLRRGDLGDQVEPVHRRLRRDQRGRLRGVVALGEDAAAHRAGVADVAHERPRVDAGDRRHAAVAQPVEPPALGGRAVLVVAGLAHDRRARVDAVGLHRRGADAVVADVRVGEGDQLARVGGVGHRLLVARHRGVEDDLAGDRRRARRRPPRRSGSPSSSRT